MNREQIIETMARGGNPLAWGNRPGLRNARYDSIAKATAALSALETAGLVVVPVEPTEAMSDAGFVRLCDHRNLAPKDVYTAMIKAAQEDKP